MNVLIPAPSRHPYLDGDSVDGSRPIAWTIPHVLAPDECTALIARIETLGPELAPVSTASGPVMRPDVRNNARVIVDDQPLADLLYARIQPHVPAQMFDGMVPVGCNERFRCYRYSEAQRFAPHYDGAFQRNDREESLLTFMVYLNAAFTGGTTDFLDFAVSVQPATGLALVFQHRVLHEGCPVTSGVKYVLRSDVMYQRGMVST